MKTIPLILLTTVLAGVLPSSAQEGQPNVRPPRPRMAIQPGQAIQPGHPAPAEAAEFPANLKLTLEGSLFGAAPTNFSILAGAPTFSASLPLKSDGEIPIFGSVDGVITPGTPYTVQISLGARVPIKTGNSIEYRDLTIRTSVRVVPGKKVALWQNGEQKLELALEEVAD